MLSHGNEKDTHINIASALLGAHVYSQLEMVTPDMKLRRTDGRTGQRLLRRHQSRAPRREQRGLNYLGTNPAPATTGWTIISSEIQLPKV